MDVDDDLLPISALQHVVFCDRQAALIHIERIWLDDAATTQGHLAHRRVDAPGAALRQGVRVARAVPLVSRRLRVYGVADMVELHPVDGHGPRPIPVEVKKGRTKTLRADEVQLCAQAMCLEERFGVDVPEGYVFYATTHRRRRVDFGDELRDETIRAASHFRDLVARRVVPPPTVAPSLCAACSLEPVCMPSASRNRASARRYLERLAREDT